MGVSMLEPDDKKRPDSSGHFGLCVSDQRKVRLGLIYGGSRPQALDDEYYSLFKASSIRLLEIGNHGRPQVQLTEEARRRKLHAVTFFV